jgi:hypothetical protein
MPVSFPLFPRERTETVSGKCVVVSQRFRSFPQNSTRGGNERQKWPSENLTLRAKTDLSGKIKYCDRRLNRWGGNYFRRQTGFIFGWMLFIPLPLKLFFALSLACACEYVVEVGRLGRFVALAFFCARVYNHAQKGMKDYTVNDVRRAVRAIASYCDEVDPDGKFPPALSRPLAALAREILGVYSIGPDHDRRWLLPDGWRKHLSAIGFNTTTFELEDPEKFETVVEELISEHQEQEQAQGERKQVEPSVDTSSTVFGWNGYGNGYG